MATNEPMPRDIARLLSMARAFEWPCRIVYRLAGWLIPILILVILYDVIGRRFFRTGSTVLQEWQWHLHGAIAVAGFGLAYIRNAHVRIDVFSGLMSERLQLRLELAVIVLFLLPFMLLVIWYGSDFAWRAFVRGEAAPGGMGLSNRWIIKSSVPLSAALTLSGAIAVALRILAVLRRPDVVASPWQEAKE